MKKHTYSIQAAIQDCVSHFRAIEEFRPSPTDTRCAMNDQLEWAERQQDWKVNHGYSQERAHKSIRRSLRDG